MTVLPLGIARRPGFTLIELLVVIAITAMLIALLMPALSKARMAAFTAKCATNQRSLTQGMHHYMHDNAGAMISARVFAETGSNPTTFWPKNHRSSLGSYLPVKLQSQGTNTAWFCPSSPYLNHPNRLYGPSHADSTTTYHYNSRLQNSGSESPDYRKGYYTVALNNPGVASGRKLGWNRLHWITTPPSRVGVLADGYYTENGSGQAVPTAGMLTFHAKQSGNLTTFAPQTGANGYFNSPHSPGTNVAFLDGHVETMTLDTVLSRWNVSPSTATIYHPFAFNY